MINTLILESLVENFRKKRIQETQIANIKYNNPYLAKNFGNKVEESNNFENSNSNGKQKPNLKNINKSKDESQKEEINRENQNKL